MVRVRKNAADLTILERYEFVWAVKALKAQVGGKNYDWFVMKHVEYFYDVQEPAPSTEMISYAHRSPSFLPWHRQFVIEFENALRNHVSYITVPYWDWTVNRNPDEFPWTFDFMGGNGVGDDITVQSGPFRKGKWTTVGSPTNQTALTRNWSSGELPTAADVADVLATTPYSYDPDLPPPAGMRHIIEGGVHDSVHNWIGGNMSQEDSPNDPIFFLHHCNIDRIWSRWQALPGNGYGPEHYRPSGGSLGMVDVDEPMRPFGAVTVSSVLDHRSLYVYQ